MMDKPTRPVATWLFIASFFIVFAGAALIVRFAGTPARKAQPTAASGEVVTLLETSIIALELDESAHAAQLLEQALRHAPHEPALWANLGLAHMRQNDHAQAAAELAEAAKLAPDAPAIAVLQAHLATQRGEADKAVEHLRRAHELDPDDMAVAYALASALLSLGDHEAEAAALLETIAATNPRNLRIRCEQARLAARDEAGDRLAEALAALEQQRDDLPDAAGEQLDAAVDAARDGRFRDAATAVVFFENLIKPAPAYQQSLAALDVEGMGMGRPIRGLLRLDRPAPRAAEADLAMTFHLASAEVGDDAAVVMLWTTSLRADGEPVVLALADDVLHIGASKRIALPAAPATASRACVLPVDLDNAMRMDLVFATAQGCLVARHTADGTFTAPTSLHDRPADHVWALDADLDGDMDLVTSASASPPLLLRNNGDGTFTEMDTLANLPPVRQLLWVDLDNDGDGDLIALDAQGTVTLWHNQRAGRYERAAPDLATTAAAMAVGDVDRDGRFDIVTLDERGAIRRHWLDEHDAPQSAALADWASFNAANGTGIDLHLADLDNNGALDIIATADGVTGIWLGGHDAGFTALAQPPAMRVVAIDDLDGDGRLDLVGLRDATPTVARNDSEAGYHWQMIAPRANANAGDQRINSFALGGRVEVRAGVLAQAAPITGPRVHFGLGDHARAGVLRIIWPNGVAQAELEPAVDQTFAAEQRLKGSCPFVFTWNGESFEFVKDFIWRSPLGLRINAQATAGITQTEDWILIPGEQLVADDGVLKLRITAELWETHFFDHVSLLVVDHPADVDLFVDERFSPAASPRLEAVAVAPLRALAGAWDHHGEDVSTSISAVDGRYVDSFALGRHQGVAEDHWLEFELPDDAPDASVVLVGRGWVYPTDSSLNVAMAQGRHPRPYGVTLEQQRGDGQWHALHDNFGYPAGKNKTVLIPLPDGVLDLGRRMRLRTNLEVYWDAVHWTTGAPEAELRHTHLPAKVAALRHRGFSRLSALDRRMPDIPDYHELAGAQPRWRDLEGYYTRFGDVRELLATIDDRYVIMNAGDELVLSFDAPPPPADGQKRDYVLVGDGWVKDGDFNTEHSRTVHPLPRHGSEPGAHGPLMLDPVYQQHRDDWTRFHTRYVTPRRFERGVWPDAARTRTAGERP